MSKRKVLLTYDCHFTECSKTFMRATRLREHLKTIHDFSLANFTRQRGKPPSNLVCQIPPSESDSEDKLPSRYGCSGCYESFQSLETLSSHMQELHTESIVAGLEPVHVNQNPKRNNQDLQSPSTSSGVLQALDGSVKKRKGYETPTGSNSVRLRRDLFEELTASLEENPLDDDDDPLMSLTSDLGLEFKHESDEEWFLNGEDVLKNIYQYQNASLRHLRQKSPINENMERILSLSSIILIKDHSTVFNGSIDRSQLREAIKSEHLSALKSDMNDNERSDVQLLRNVLTLTLREKSRTAGLKALDGAEMKELSRLKEVARYLIGHHPFRKVSHVGRNSETETECTVSHLYPFMLNMYDCPDRVSVVFGNSGSTASAARINGRYQARQPDGVIKAVHGHASLETGYTENKFSNATKANVAKDLMRLCRFAKDSLDLLRRKSVDPDLFVTLNQVVDHHVDLYFAKRQADGYTLVTQVGSYELPCTVKDMLTFLDDYEELHMFFKASLNCADMVHQILVTNPPTMADPAYRQCVSTPDLKKFLLL